MKTLILYFLFLPSLVFGQIKIHGVKLLAINEGGTRTAKVSISLGSSENKTVNAASVSSLFTLSAASLTFTTSNWYTPQTLTLTGVVTSGNDDCQWDILRLTATGHTTVDVKVAVVDDDTLLPHLNGRRWADENKNINSLADVTTWRAWLIAQIFNGDGIPTNAVPTASTIGYTGAMHSLNTSELTSESSVNKYTFTYNDVDGYTWTYYVYHIITDQTPTNQIVFIEGGHTIGGGSETQDQVAINLLNAAGVDCMYIAMPVAGENTETNPNISTASSTITTRHEQILLNRLDRPSWNAFCLFLAGGFQAVNWIEANLPTYEIICFSHSGGSIFATWGAALYEGIDRVFVSRGIVFRALSDPVKVNSSDYELGGTREVYYKTGLRLWEVTQNIESIDRLVLACSNGRTVVVMHHTDDTALISAGGEVDLVYYDWISTLGSQVSGTLSMRVTKGAGNSAHEYHTDDVNYVISQL